MTAKVLLVEDEPGIQLALKGLLKRDGHELVVAATGEEAIRAIDEGDFDLVLTDLSLPGKASGLDILRHTVDHRPGTPVILITAFDSEETAREAQAIGVFDYVPKPFDNNTVRSVVNRALRSR